MLNKLRETKILGFPIWMFFGIALVLIGISLQNALLNNMVGALAFAFFVGTVLGYIGDRIPIWNQWLGGGMLFTCLAAGALNTFKLLPAKVVATLNTFNGSTGFLDLYILVLITGSVLSVDRKMLLRSFGAYIPTILAGIVGAFGFAALAGLVVGVKPLEAIMQFALPIMGGGNGAGAIPMSQIWGNVTGKDPQSWYAPAFAILSLGNLFAVLSAAVLNKLGNKYPSLTGNGQLMKMKPGSKTEKLEDIKIGIGEYAAGLGLALFCFVFADFYAAKISFINRAGLGFTIHKFAFMVILIMLLNISGIIPAEIRAGAKGMQTFFAKYMSLPLMVTVGIGTNLGDYARVLSIPNLVIIVAVVLGAIVATGLIAPLFKFYPIESIITAGLCMANGGGSGDVQVLGVANRMELMSYAQISSRIGGAIMLVIASFMFGKFL